MSYQSWSVSFAEQPSASKWNILGTNDAYFNSLLTGTGTVQSTVLTNPYKFSVYQSGDLGISSGVATKAQLDTKLFDTGNNFDNVTNYRFIAPIAGFYFISAQVGLTASGAGFGVATTGYILKNGIAIVQSGLLDGSGNAGRIPRPSMNKLVQMAANDYLELEGQVNEGGRHIAGGSTITFMSGFLVSAT